MMTRYDFIRISIVRPANIRREAQVHPANKSKKSF